MATTLEYGDAAFAATQSGIFIPVADLPGLDGAELAAGESAQAKEAKTLLALLNGFIAGTANLSALLGLTVTQNTPSANGANLLTLNYSITWQKLVDLANNTIKQIPVPTAGANLDAGKVSVLDIFPNAAAIAAAANTPGAGVIIPTADLASYGVTAAPALNAGDDDRAWFDGLFSFLVSATVRATGVTSAVTAASRGGVGSATIPAAFTQDTDPTSGIATADLPTLGLISRTIALSVQVLLSQSGQTFDVNVA